jgi:hypothetical protein
VINPTVLALSALLLSTGLAHAAGGGQGNNSNSEPIVQYNISLPSNHSAVVPGIDPPANPPSIGDFPAPNKNLPSGGSNVPDVGVPGVSNPGGGSASVGTTAGERRGQFALACDLKANGDIVFVNIGEETLDGGARIKWSARGRQGYFALNVDLPSGGQATAADVIDTSKSAPCLASVL